MKNKKALMFYSDIYRQNFCYLKGWTREEVEEALDEDLGKAGGVTTERGDAIIIWVESVAGEGISDLCHECVHAANITLGQRGVKVSANQDEAQAYLVQWIFWNCLKPVKRVRKS